MYLGGHAVIAWTLTFSTALTLLQHTYLEGHAVKTNGHEIRHRVRHHYHIYLSPKLTN